MQIGALQPYEQALHLPATIELVTEDGQVFDLDVERWLADADDADLSAIERCTEPTLDVGCGPGRVVRALYDRGIAALGVDIAGVAVAIANERGGPALHVDIFDRVPGEGRWASILLLDGNVGIGGDVDRLLARGRELLRPGGSLIVEASPWVAAGRDPMQVRFRSDGTELGGHFPWVVLDLEGVVAAGRRAGLQVADTWSVGARAFARLSR